MPQRRKPPLEELAAAADPAVAEELETIDAELEPAPHPVGLAIVDARELAAGGFVGALVVGRAGAAIDRLPALETGRHPDLLVLAVRPEDRVHVLDALEAAELDVHAGG